MLRHAPTNALIESGQFAAVFSSISWYSHCWVESPAALANAIASCFNPDEAIEGLTEEQKCELGKALINIGADMSIPEREKAEDIVVVTIIAGQIVLGTAYRRKV